MVSFPGFRIETDSLGSKEIPAEALYGIHSVRAKENFPDQTPFHIEWYKALGVVKLSCYKAYSSFCHAVKDKRPGISLPFELLETNILEAMDYAATSIAKGEHFDSFIVPAISGGAGTSINMNVNEIIANLALAGLGLPYGNYERIDPIEAANIYQSTNDVVPTALKVAVIQLLAELEQSVNALRQRIEGLESKYSN